MTKFALLYLSLLLASSAAISCNLNSTEPVAATLPSLAAGPARQVVLSNNTQLNVPDASGVLQLHSADSFALLDQLDNWPTATGEIGSIDAQPVMLDTDYDGRADGLYIVDVNGAVWFIPLTSTGFATPLAIADFSDSGLQFRQPLRLVQTVAANSAGLTSNQSMLLLVGSSADNGDTLFALRHQPQRLEPVQLTDLTERSSISADELLYGIDELLWQQIQRSSGWYVQLNGSITSAPQVYAGVIYLTAADIGAVQPDCSLVDDAELALHALHLHHAGSVYARRNWPIDAVAHAELTLQHNSEGQLELSLSSVDQQSRLVSELLAISEECADCTESLTADQFPKTIRLATYQTEDGAH